MDKEKDIKKIVAVVIVLIVALVAFVLIRGCSKDDTSEPTTTPTPTDNAEVTPKPTPDEDENHQSNNVPTTKPTVEKVVDKVEVKPTPIKYASKAQLDELRELIDIVMSDISNIAGSNDDHVAELVNNLNKLCKKAESLIEKENATSTDIESMYDELENAYVELMDYVMGLYEQVLDAVDALQEDFTKENIEALKELIKKLPDMEEKDELMNAVHVFELQEELMDTTLSEVELNYDIKLYDSLALALDELGRDVVINGNGHTLTVESGTTTGIDIITNHEAGSLTPNNITIKNMIIDMKQEESDMGVATIEEEDPGFGDVPVYGISVFESTNVTIEDVTVKNADIAIVVESSDVTLSGEITLEDNTYSGIEVYGMDTNPSTLTLADGVVLTNNVEGYDNPTIATNLANVTVENNSSVVLYSANLEFSINYYLTEANKEAPVVTE